VKTESCDVLIVGGGPCGLMLANELGRRNIKAVVIDQKETTAFNPQANATQARTMEHYRRLGFSEQIRSLGLPPEFPSDIAYFTRFSRYELARLKLPSAEQARRVILGLTGSWSAAELPHRVSQKFVEAVLRQQAEALPTISIRFRHRLLDFNEGAHAVSAVVEDIETASRLTILAKYLVGADGARSFVRDQLRFDYEGERGAVRDFLGGSMYAVYLRARGFYQTVGHAPAWMNFTFNPDRRAFMAAVDGKGEFAFHTQLRDGEDANVVTENGAKALFHAAVGMEVEAQVLSRGPWTAGYALVANKYRRGRVILGGDAVHLFTPTGGLGYNTAVEDAVNLGWKLASVIKGVSSPWLLDTYESERRPIAIRNTTFARHFADSIGVRPAQDIEDEGLNGEEARLNAGLYLKRHVEAEFNIPGITFGGRYDGSPIVVSDGTAPPADHANQYIPSACPGGRPPHLWLDGGRSLFDTFGFNWTLLCLNNKRSATHGIAEAAAANGLDIKVVNVEHDGARDLYEADLALIRPDQIVAWRGSECGDPNTLAKTVAAIGPRAEQ
jgi:2-polyprenyl-6-methoxyphenol hydroxylase-like FAD-dependent oxidoreductase